MSVGGRATTRGRLLRRLALIAGALVLVALLFLVGGHWVLAIVFGVPGLAVGWAYFQARTVR